MSYHIIPNHPEPEDPAYTEIGVYPENDTEGSRLLATFILQDGKLGKKNDAQDGISFAPVVTYSEYKDLAADADANELFSAVCAYLKAHGAETLTASIGNKKLGEEFLVVNGFMLKETSTSGWYPVDHYEKTL